MVMGLDDVGEFAQEVGAAQGVVTLAIAEVGGPAIVDQDTAIAWDDADRLDCLDASFGMEDLERQGPCGKDVDPVVLAFDTQRGLDGRHRFGRYAILRAGEPRDEVLEIERGPGSIRPQEE